MQSTITRRAALTGTAAGAAVIVAAPAVTVAGLLVKARAVWWIYRDDPENLVAEASGTDDELLRSITVNLWAMQESQS